MSRKAEMEREIKLLKYTLENTRYELHRLRFELSLVRESYVGLLRRIQKAMGLKNWPNFKGDFLDGVSKMIIRRLKAK